MTHVQDDSVRRWLFTTNHKDIGILYLITSLYFFVVGGLLSLLVRGQLAAPDGKLLTASAFNQAVTIHGLVMVLWFLSPLAFAFANYMVPLQIGTRDLAFPRLNAMSYWFYLFGGLLAAVGFFTPGGAADVGWTVYAPLSSVKFTPVLGLTLGGAGLLMLVVSVTLSTVNFLVTILRSRASGLKLLRMPYFTWMMFFTVVSMLFAFPALAAGLLALAADRLLGTVYFTSREGGSLLWGHLFWFFGHPEVYIVLLPALGVVGEVLPVFARRPLYGKKILIAATAAAVVLSFIVWGHHMYVTGISLALREFMVATTEAISIPFGLIILSFIGTLAGGSIRFKTPMLFAIGSIFLFVIGGITGVFNSSVALDYNLRGTYWVVGHFHYTLVGGATLGLFAGLYYWYPKITGRMYSERLGKLHFLISFIGFNALFFPMLLLLDMPRRIFTYSVSTGWAGPNLVATVGGIIFGVAQLFLFVNLLYSLRRGSVAPGNPWGGWTAEWATTSPPPPHNFAAAPVFTAQGLVTLAGGATEATNLHVAVTHLSRWPLLFALATFLFFLGVGLGPVVLVGGAVVFVAALAGWMRDDIMGRFIAEEAPAGERWPYESLKRVKLGMWLFLGGEIVLFGSLISAYVFVRLRSASWPTPGEILALPIGAANTFILLTSSLTLVLALAAARRGSAAGLKAGLAATLLLGAVFLVNKGVEWRELFSHGLGFASGLPATTFFVTTGAHGAHVLAGLVGLLYLLGKAFAIHSAKESADTVEHFGLYWHFVDIVWVFLFPIFYLI